MRHAGTPSAAAWTLCACVLWTSAGCQSSTSTDASQPAHEPTPSQPDAGSDFRIELPNAEQIQQSPPPGQPAAAAATPDHEVTPNATSDAAATPEPTSAAVELGVGDEQALAKLLDKHRGQVVLVDFWALWCPPCMEQFPHTVALAKTHAAAGLRVISVSGDDGNETDQRERVLTFLTKHQATFDNLISPYGVGQEHFEKFQIETGGIPYYTLYDREGKVRYKFTSVPNVDDVENLEEVSKMDQRIAELLAEPAKAE